MLIGVQLVLSVAQICDENKVQSMILGPVGGVTFIALRNKEL